MQIRIQSDPFPSSAFFSHLFLFIYFFTAEAWERAAASSPSAMELESNYEIALAADFIRSRNFTRVALQVRLAAKKKSRGLDANNINFLFFDCYGSSVLLSCVLVLVFICIQTERRARRRRKEKVWSIVIIVVEIEENSTRLSQRPR